MESINLFGDGFVAAVVLAFVIIPIWVIGKVLIEDSWPKDLQQKVAYYRMNTPPEWRFDDRIEKNHFFFDLDNERFFCYRTTGRLGRADLAGPRGVDEGPFGGRGVHGKSSWREPRRDGRCRRWAKSALLFPRFVGVYFLLQSRARRR